jgi:hypothetical protein
LSHSWCSISSSMLEMKGLRRALAGAGREVLESPASLLFLLA